MQSMRPNIPPEPIQPDFPSRRPGARRFKNAPRNPQRRISRYNLDACNPLGYLSPLRCRYVSFRAVVGVDVRDFGAGEVS